MARLYLFETLVFLFSYIFIVLSEALSYRRSLVDMGSTAPTGLVRVAVTQHEPVWLDLEGAVTKTIAIIKQAAAEGAKLVAFPECWVRRLA